MSDPNRKVAKVVELIDIDVEMPQNGQLVLALGLGGKLCEEVWTSNSHKFFKAFMPYPKIPASVKEKLMKQYGG